MASGGAALLLCGLFFLSSSAPTACSCPLLSQLSCNGSSTSVDFKHLQPCGSNRFQCRNSTMKIQFGGAAGAWYTVVRAEPVFNDTELDVEDPILTPFFSRTDCDFLYSFLPPGPLFPPPRHGFATSLHHLQSYCNVSDYSLLFSNKLICRQQQQGSSCIAYDLYGTSKELGDPQHPAPLPGVCLPVPDHPMFIWKLRTKNNSDGDFNIVSAGFSRRHQLYRSCFNKQEIGFYTCGAERSRHLRRMLIIGFSIATGVSILASLLFYLWRRNKKTETPPSSTLLSQTTSLEASFEKDPEGGSMIYLTHVFRYDELHDATNGFSPSNELDHGGHGAVYKGMLQDGRPVAIKRLYENSSRRAEQFTNEIAILSRLRHPNLVALYGCSSRHSRELLLVFEFIPNGTIADHLHGRRAAEGALTWPLRLRIAVETATALAYLHALRPPIIHRDVKTQNILLDGDFHVKVADFGLSRLLPVAASHVSTVPQGTPGYVDPEYHRCYQLTDKSDVYSFGVVLAELISSKPAFDVARSQHEITLANMALGKIQNAALQELVDSELGFETNGEVRRSIELVAELAMRCLQWEKDMRPSMEDVLDVLQRTADGLHQVEKGGEADHMTGDDIGLLKACAPVSPDSVIGKWSSRKTTPNASG